MSLATNIQNLATRIGTEIKAVNGRQGNLASLSTTAKGNLVAALNEVAASVGSAGAPINDTAPSTLSVYSSSKTLAEIGSAVATAKAELLGGAGTAYDTLKELQDLLVAKDGDVAAITTALANRLRFDAAQPLSAPQKVQGNANLGSVSLVQSGDPETNYVTTFEAALI